jgi:hypothetical protein
MTTKNTLIAGSVFCCAICELILTRNPDSEPGFYLLSFHVLG